MDAMLAVMYVAFVHRFIVFGPPYSFVTVFVSVCNHEKTVAAIVMKLSE